MRKAVIRVSAQLLAESLFGQTGILIFIAGATYNYNSDTIDLVIESDQIPEGAEHVQALFTQRQLTVQFKRCEAPS